MKKWSVGLCLALVLLGVAGLAFGAVKDDYLRGVTSLNSLLEHPERGKLRTEWEAVMAHFHKALKADPKGEYAPKALYLLGRTYEELGKRSYVAADRKEALEVFDRMLASYPKHPWTDDALYRKGMIWQEQFRSPDKARPIFEAVVKRYPDGDMAPKAREYLGQQGGVSTAPGTPAAPAAVAKSVVKPVAKKSAPAGDGPVLNGIRHWSSPEYTRVVMDLSGDVQYARNLVQTSAGSGKQLQITLQGARVGSDVTPVRSIRDGILSELRVDGVDTGALVTIDLMQMDHYRVFSLPEPYRVVLDIYGLKDGKQTAPAPVAEEPASGGRQDHVQAALNELRAETKAEPVAPKKATSSKAAPKTSPSKKAATPAPSKASPPEPQIKVSAKQKKYSGSLIEQLGLKVRTIMLDPGHGGNDPGAMISGYREKDVNLRMAKILGAELKAQGFAVHYTRTSDKYVALEERTAMANARDADLFISLHCNAYKDASASGLEIYYLNLATDQQAVRVAARENGVSAKKISDMQFILSDLMLNSKIKESRQLAGLISQETLRAARKKYALGNHGSKGAFFYVLTGARMPAVLVEMGYLTNPAEAKRLSSDSYLRELAKGMVGGIVAYRKKLEKYAVQGTS